MVRALDMREAKAREYIARYGARALDEARKRLRASVNKRWFWKGVCEWIHDLAMAQAIAHEVHIEQVLKQAKERS